MLAAVGELTMEAQALAEIKAIASQNQRYKSFICMGYKRSGDTACYSA
ncbi:hypothetical protein [Sodalis-like endosymbiont of Proechinophthirus fluctus]